MGIAVRLALFAVALVACSSGPPAEVKLHELAPGVFARTLVGIASSNQAFVVFDEHVVVFDPGSAGEAKRLLRQIREHTPKPVAYVVNSHFHPDHSGGAAVFAAEGAQVVAAAASREDYAIWVRVDFEKKVEYGPEEYADLEYAPPTVWVEGAHVFDDGTQRLELAHHGHGHTRGDLVGWLPGPRVLLAGDLSTNGQHNLANADVASWIRVLERLEGYDAEVVVPGHRRLAGPEILGRSRRYLSELREQVGAGLAAGQTWSEVMETIAIPFYEEWSGVAVADEPANVAVVYRELGGEIGEDETRRRRWW